MATKLDKNFSKTKITLETFLNNLSRNYHFRNNSFFKIKLSKITYFYKIWAPKLISSNENKLTQKPLCNNRTKCQSGTQKTVLNCLQRATIKDLNGSKLGFLIKNHFLFSHHSVQKKKTIKKKEQQSPTKSQST